MLGATEGNGDKAARPLEPLPLLAASRRAGPPGGLREAAQTWLAEHSVEQAAELVVGILLFTVPAVDLAADFLARLPPWTSGRHYQAQQRVHQT